MKKEYILFIDSGIGGLSTLVATYKKYPGNYLYFADNANSPYGAHTKAEIYGFLEKIINSITQKYNVRIVVLACNTATTSSIEKLRNKFNNLKFIGTEPAIKLAQKQQFKKILCLSTPATAKQKKYQVLKKQIEQTGSIVVSHELNTFAKCIDNFYVADSTSARFEMRKNLYQIKALSENFDSIVLGCTHYCLVAREIELMTKKPIIDGNAGVAQQVFAMHTKYSNNLINNKQPSVIFLFSDSSKTVKQKYKKIFKQILAYWLNLC